MTPLQLARQDAERAYYAHDHDGLVRALDRIAGCVDLSVMTAGQLLARRQAIYQEAVDISDRLAALAHQSDHLQPLLQAPPAGSLDPSDPSDHA